MRKIIHLIPYDGIGGVEAAARSMIDTRADDLTFTVRFLFPTVTAREQRGATFNPLRLVTETFAIAGAAPDLLVVSLWRSAIVGILVRLLNARVRLVTFVHNSKDAHAADRVVTRLAIRLSEAVWTDSAASVQRRFARPLGRPVTTISYLAQHLEPLPAPAPDAPPAPVFAFWGRLSAQKNVGRALAFFARIHAARPDARFLVIGPDGGEETMLRELASDLGLDQAVTFTGSRPFEAIRPLLEEAGARFCLQASRYEGMAMSVTEAMQLGLVPVVSPVGEIAHYCREGDNAVLLPEAEDGDDGPAAAAVLSLLEDPAGYAALRASGVARWTDQPLYRDSVMAAARGLLTTKPAN